MTTEDTRDAPERARIEWEGLGLGLLTGVLYGLPFVFRSLWPLAWVAFVPMAAVYALPRYRRGDAPAPFGVAVVTVLVAMLLGVAIPISKISTVAGFVQPLFYLPFPLLAMFALRRGLSRTRLPCALLLPVTWVTAELLWSRYSLGALAFELIGYTQFQQRLLIQVADLTGVAGVSFLVCLVNGALVDVLRARSSRDPRDARTARLAAATAAAALALTLGYGALRDRGEHVSDGPRIALVQPNLPHGFVNFSEVHARQMDMVMARIAPGQCDLIALPENALQDYIQNPGYYEDFAVVGAKVKTPILIGANGIPPEHRGKKTLEPLPGGNYPVANEAVLVSPDGTVMGEVIKIHLLPWSESVPFFEELHALHPPAAAALRGVVADVLGFAGGAVPGTEVTPLELPTPEGERTFWVPICFESADSGLAREGTRKGAEFLVNITSEGLLGEQIYWNMIAICTFRAVENRVGIARATNSGISCFISPDGRIGPLLVGDHGRMSDDSGVLVDRIKIDSWGPTLYTRVGDWLAWTCTAGTVALLMATWRPRRRVGEPGPSSASPPRERA